ncbi:peptidase M16 domain-containing protein [Marssonina coronariae]|uniref:Peptidase M16 domain-containing protein n=1 Tax=Diplocarpon coronariae TaxID=2795749 RepID=A0A218YX96_9HELO|nr:peptidase M16 domain-containing protein [Marssonina coronariae]
MAAEGQKGACWLMSSPKAFHDEDGARLARAGSDGGYRSDLVCHPDLIIPTISHISANVQDQSEITDERRGRLLVLGLPLPIPALTSRVSNSPVSGLAGQPSPATMRRSLFTFSSRRSHV